MRSLNAAGAGSHIRRWIGNPAAEILDRWLKAIWKGYLTTAWRDTIRMMNVITLGEPVQPNQTSSEKTKLMLATVLGFFSNFTAIPWFCNSGESRYDSQEGGR